MSKSSGERIELDIGDEPVTIGRSPNNAVVLDHEQVSRQHAVITVHQGVPSITDLGSKNGTWLNNVRLTQAQSLAEGDRLKIGSVEFVIRSHETNTRTLAPARAAEETVTVMFTDLKGHTELFEELGTDKAHGLVMRLLNLMSHHVRTHAGTVVKTEGDGVIATFLGVRDAVSCALQIQREVHALPNSQTVPVRIGINTGDVVREANDVMGVTVIKAARIMAQADGGEILIGEASRLLLGPADNFRVASKGWFTLKGISRRERLYAVAWQDV